MNLFLLSASLLAGAANESVIVCGPDVQVSLDADVPHVEMQICANPRDPKNLVATSIVLANSPLVNNRVELRTYATQDGGWTWHASTFPNSKSPDPIIAVGPDGEVYFTGIGLPLFRSTSGGAPGTWEVAGKWADGDHPMMTVDTTNSPYRGRLYISNFGYSLESLDPGTPMIPRGNVKYPEPSTMSFQPLVLSDGTVFLPFTNYFQAKDKSWKVQTRFVLSTDGGQTVSSPKQILVHSHIGYQERKVPSAAFLSWAVNPAFAVWRRSQGDRIFMVWEETSSKIPEWLADPKSHRPTQVYITHSDDRGQTWSAKRLVDPSSPLLSAQWNCSVAVNQQGVVGVSWLDTRDDPKVESFRPYFAASTDGGETFLPPRAVASRSSNPYGQGNRTLNFHTQSEKDGVLSLGLDSGWRRWSLGGDYLGMAAAADGRFFPIWPDARSGTYQLFTAPIDVLQASDVPTSPEGLVEKDVTSQTRLRFDLPRFDETSETATFPIRVQNVGKTPIFGPLRIELLDAKDLRLKGEAGNVGDYSEALRDWQALPPGGVSQARLWEFVNTSVQRVPSFRVKVFGRVPNP